MGSKVGAMTSDHRTMIIIGIDPGIASTGLAAIYRAGNVTRWVTGREIRTSPAWPSVQRLRALHLAARDTAFAVQKWVEVELGTARITAAIEAFEARAGGGRNDRKACPACGSPSAKDGGKEIARFRRTAIPHGMAMGALLAGLDPIPLGEPPIRAVDWHRRLKLPPGDPKRAAAQFAASAIDGLPAVLADHVTDAACIALAARVAGGERRG